MKVCHVIFVLFIFLLIPQNIYGAVDSTVGSFDVDVKNTVRFNEILFQRTEITNNNSDQKNNSVLISVTYPASFELNCTTHYKLANTDKEHTSLQSTNIDSNTKQTSFRFTNISNEIVTLRCYDVQSDATAFYVISNNDFPLKDVFSSFRDGTYGTSGKLGYLDMITVFVVIFSMVGFNQKNQVVGAIMSAIIIGVTWHFGIIQMPTSILGIIVTITMFVVFSSRKK